MAQRRLNKNLVVGLVLGLMVVITAAAIGLLVHWKGPEAEAEPYRRMAVQAYASGDLEAAMKAYGRAYGRTRDPIWLVEQGRVAREMADAGMAFQAWDRAVTDNPSLIDAHKERIKLRLELVAVPGFGTAQQHNHLRAAAEALLAQRADDPLGKFAKGIALTGLETEDPKNMEKGIQLIEEAHELDVTNVKFAQSLARVYDITSRNRRDERKFKEYDEYRQKAEEVYLELIKSDPESEVGYQAYAEFLMDRYRGDVVWQLRQKGKVDQQAKAKILEQIKDNLERAEKYSTDPAQLGMHWAQYYTLAEKPEEVIKALQTVIEKAPDHLQGYIELATKQFARRKPDEALATLEKGLAQKIDRLGYKGGADSVKRFQMLCLACEILLSKVHGVTDKEKREELLEQASDYYEQAIVERDPEVWMARQVEGQLREAQGRFAEAEEAYSEADKKLSWRLGQRRYKMQNLLRLSRLYLQRLNAAGEAIKRLNEILQQSPRSRVARLLRGEAYLAVGRDEEAVDDAKAILVDAEGLGEDHWIVDQARRLALRGYHKLDKLDEVKKLSKELGTDSLADQARQALIYELEKEPQKAGEIYLKLLAKEPANPQIVKRAVRLFMSMDKSEQVEKILKRAQKEKPNGALFKRLALLVDKSLTDEQRDAKMLELIKSQEDELTREVALSQYYLEKGDLKTSLDHVKKARELRPEDGSLLEREFFLALQQKDWDLATSCWEQAVRLNADAAGGRFYKGRLELVKGELTKAKSDKLAAEDPTQARELNGQAQAHFDEAAKALREGLEEYDKSSAAYYWLGTAEEKRGNLIDARDAYTVAVRLDPTNANAHRALAQMGRVHGNVANVDDHLKEAIRLAKKDKDGLPLQPWLRMQVESEREQADPKAAIERREKVRKEKPDDIYNLMRLALLYERVKDFEKAESCLKSALEAEPTNLALVLNTARYHRRREAFDKAEKLLQEQVDKADEKEKWRAQLLKAQHYVALWRHLLGQKKRDPEKIQQAMAAADNAYTLAVKLGNAPPHVYTEAASWYEMTNRDAGARHWLREGLMTVKDETDEVLIRRRLLRLFLSMKPVPTDAQREVRDYLTKFPDDPVGLLFDGELKAAQGKLGRAIEAHTAYLDLISRQGKGPSQLARLAEGHFLRGKLYLRQSRNTYTDREALLRQALSDLNRSKSLAPEGFRSGRHRVELARCLEMMGKTEQAVRELKSILSENPDASLATQELVRLYARMKNWPAQETLIRQQMSLFPDKWQWPYLLGTQFEQRDKDRDAIPPLRKACELLDYKVFNEFEQNQPVVALLRVLGKTNANKEIIDVVSKHVAEENRTSDIAALYGGALAKMGKQAEAMKAFEKAVRRSTSFKVYARVVQHFASTLGFKQATELVQKEHEKRGEKSVVPALMLASLKYYDKKPAEGLPLITQAVQAATDPNTPGLRALCLTNQAILLGGQGKKEEAAKAYTDALKLGRDLTVLNNLAYTLAEDLNRAKDAYAYAELAARMAPNDAAVLDTLGWCLHLMGRSEDAVGVLQESIDLNPMLVDAHVHLAHVYAKQGSKDRAANQLRAIRRELDTAGDQDGMTRVDEAMKELGIQA